MRRHLPNTLTMCRAVLAAAFFVVLNNYRYGAGPSSALIAAFVIFIVAALTDWADGYLARRWKAESAFGRIMDPFCDKLLVLGALIYLAGPRFVDPSSLDSEGHFWGVLPNNMITGVYPWMVAAVLARELLVTSIRGELEGRGAKFGAKMVGKLKATLQMVVIPTVIAIVWLDPRAEGFGWTVYVRDVIVYATVLVSVASGLPYITAARKTMVELPPPSPNSTNSNDMTE